MGDAELKIVGKLTEPFNPQTMDWLTYEDLLKNMLLLNNVVDESKRKMTIMGAIGMQAYGELRHAINGKNLADLTSENLLEMLSDRFSPKKLVVAQRDKFLGTKQKPTQTLTELVAELQNVAMSCDFEKITTATEAREAFMLQAFLRSLKCENTRVRLLQQENLTFKKAYEMACILEEADKEGPTMGENKPSHYVGRVQNDYGRDRRQSDYREDRKPICYACGTMGHIKSECKYRDIVCQLCNRKGHLATECFKNKRREEQRGESTYSRQENPPERSNFAGKRRSSERVSEVCYADDDFRPFRFVNHVANRDYKDSKSSSSKESVNSTSSFEFEMHSPKSNCSGCGVNRICFDSPRKKRPQNSSHGGKKVDVRKENSEFFLKNCKEIEVKNMKSMLGNLVSNLNVINNQIIAIQERMNVIELFASSDDINRASV